MTPLANYDTSVRFRGQVEQLIVTKVVDLALAAGYRVSVDDGGEELPITKERAEVLNQLVNTDEDRLYVYRADIDRPFGWVYFVYGNDGFDVISDYTTNLEELLAPAHELANKLENGEFTITV